MTGLMSAAIANVRSAQAAASAVTGLPGNAAAIQSAMATTMDAMVGHVEGACTAIVSAANASTAPLDAADAAVEAGNADNLATALGQIQANMAQVSQQVTAANDQVKASLNSIIDDCHTLAGIGNDLAADITRAQAKADEAARAADALDKKKWYYLILGPFGAVGLAACIALIVEAQKKVDSLRSQVSNLRGQATKQQKVQADLDLLRDEVPTVSNALMSLQNGLSFLQGDTSAVVEDVRRTPGSSIAKAFLLAARHEVQTLASDAS
ncbi:hypothetical protein [Aestuariimicrobium sp. Y1814]|uniref:hypothetical protein n=1 Tax=Aestuariimicrobium sp. Y1814 TaxID=3418742 RepID=UPI003DA6F6FB